jgi:hypothetical protein
VITAQNENSLNSLNSSLSLSPLSLSPLSLSLQSAESAEPLSRITVPTRPRSSKIPSLISFPPLYPLSFYPVLPAHDIIPCSGLIFSEYSFE